MKAHAVFEGGGVKAIALVGALQAAEERAIRLEKVAGTSSGAIIASLVAAGFTGEEMKDILLATSFTDFLQR
ncbi:MAG TPA: patatin-like phospholipase family protein, partial [Bacilli bacterium]